MSSPDRNWYCEIECSTQRLRLAFRAVVLLFVVTISGASTAIADAPSATKQFEERVALLRALLNERAKEFPLSSKTADDAVDVLDYRLPRFRVKNARLSDIVFALNAAGVDVCHERADRKNKLFVDREGNAVFLAGKLISLDLTDLTIREVMKKLVEADPGFVWERVPDTRLINLIPTTSQLTFDVGHIDDSGNPYAILGRHFDKNPPRSRLVPGIIRGHNHLPPVTVRLDGGTARQLLNEMARQHRGLTWGYSNSWGVSTNYIPDAWVKHVDVVYEDIQEGTESRASARYQLGSRMVDGVSTLVVEKVNLTKSK